MIEAGWLLVSLLYQVLFNQKSTIESIAADCRCFGRAINIYDLNNYYE
jgi:hypothetical protein